MPSGHGSRRCANGALPGSTRRRRRPPATGPAPRRTRRRHAAGRSRVGVAAFSVATMLGLVGVMGLARPASSATPTAPGDTTAAPLPVPTSPHSRPAAATAAPGPAVAAPPVALTARPTRPGDDPHDGRPGRRAPMAVTEHRFRVMASDAHVIAVDAPAGALAEAQQMLERIEQRWSRFLPDSDITRINLADGSPGRRRPAHARR